jgi:acetyl-CoA C-acetyltransferase
MIKDGLWEAFNGYHMGNTAENVARQWQITREEQDKFAASRRQYRSYCRQNSRFHKQCIPGCS